MTTVLSIFPNPSVPKTLKLAVCKQMEVLGFATSVRNNMNFLYSCSEKNACKYGIGTYTVFIPKLNTLTLSR